jgi:hypothetical protein
MFFHDRAILDMSTKRLVSMRDGVLEYLGREIGREPADKTFYVYRPPSALANAARKMDGLPILDGHVEPGQEPTECESYVLDTHVVEHRDDQRNATLAASHHAQVASDLQAAIESGKREVSLGYTADLVDTEKGIEQINIQPFHLAAETEGRCGPACSFVDHRKPITGEDPMSLFKGKDKGSGQPQVFLDKSGEVYMQLPKAFMDQEGQVNMQQIVEIASALPEAIKNIPVDKLQEVFPQLQELVKMAKENDPNMQGEEPEDEEEEERYDSDGNPMTDKAKARAYEKLKDAQPQQQGKYTDAQVEKMVKDKVAQAKQQAIKDHAYVIEKARKILDSSYDFTDKSTEQIMRDAIATQSIESYEDSELPLAFKMLQPPERSTVTNFGDRSAGGGSKFANDPNRSKEL